MKNLLDKLEILHIKGANIKKVNVKNVTNIVIEAKRKGTNII